MIRRFAVSLAVLLLSGCSAGVPAASDDEIAGTTFLASTEEAEKALSTTFRGRPIRYLGLHTEGFGWDMLGLRCSERAQPYFDKVGIEGTSVREAREIMAMLEQHNARLLPSLPRRWACTPSPY